MKRAFLICGLVLLPAIASAQTPPITVLIHVEESKGYAPAPISKSDLVIFDNDDRVATISNVVPANNHDAVFGIVVDASGSNLDKVGFIKKYVIDVFDVAGRPGSKGLLFTFGSKVSGGDAWVRRNDVEHAMKSFAVEQGAPSPLYAAIIKAVQRLATLDAAQNSQRRLLFVVTDGDDTSKGVDRNDALNAALAAHVSIIPIGLLSYGREQVGRMNLNNLADATGGQAIVLDGPADLKKLLSNVLDSEYLVTFIPAQQSAYHKLNIGLSSPAKGIKVKAPMGYVSP